MPTLLHVGCGPKRKAQTTRGFQGEEWREIRFDIDPAAQPDILGTMTDLSAVADASVDALFSSHNIEHLYPFEAPVALAEFARVLTPEGFVIVTCPDLQSVAALVAEDKLLEPAYESPAGPISPLDILYGHRPLMARGNLHMAHRCGFTLKVLLSAMQAAGLKEVAGMARPKFFDLWAVGSKGLDQAAVRALALAHFPGRPA
ncbi:class I SAM-dependent methyltransferase [Phenylobacterium sp.]|jgi:predicted SAM-dependent methyltransferase|uniref:class I SAM-dependent methyltransferase n=1 Tax=Phenylobacterium sp. TaxID=1871053 RepID=UPI002F427E35